MKVLFFISSKGCYGAENMVLNLASALDKMQVNVIVGAFWNLHNTNFDFIEKANKIGLKTKILKCRGQIDFRAVSELRKFFKEQGVTIVHSHGYKSNIYSYLAAINTGVKRVATCHNWVSKKMIMKVYEMLDKLVLSKFDGVVCVSNDVKKQLSGFSQLSEKIYLIENGIDVSRFSVEKDTKRKFSFFNIKEYEIIAGTVGRISPEKGHEYLIKAFKLVSEEMPDCKLMIVGDGVLRESLELLARSLEIEDKVIFTGKRDDVPELLNLMDIFVLPSLTEGMPMALLEAMAAKKTIISTDVGSIPKMIQNDFSGLLVKPGDTAGLASAIKSLIQNKPKALELGNSAFAKVSENFSSEVMAEKYFEIYRSISIKKGLCS